MTGAKVLIVDDDRDMCAELAEILRLEGYDVDTAYDGMEAKRLAEGGGYAVILLDLKLPALGGPELLRHIKETCSSRVIVMTGMPLTGELGRTALTPETREQAIELADGIAEKPFDIARVLESIRRFAAPRSPEAL